MKRKIGTLLMVLLFVLVLCMNASAASTVAKIGTKKYTTLPKAIAAVKSGQTITLTSNVTVKGNLELALGSKKVTLNLNKKTLKVSKSLNLTKGTLTITGSGKLQAAKINNSGSLTIKNGTITGSVYNKGKLSMTGGTLNSTKNFGYTVMSDGGSMTLSGGTINYKAPVNGKPANNYGWGNEVSKGGAIVTDGKAKVTVKGGNINSNGDILLTAPYSSSTISFSKGTFNTEDFDNFVFMICGSDKVTVSGGKYKGNGFCILYGNASFKVTGGTVTSKWTILEAYAENAKATVTGGTFTSSGDIFMFLTEGGKIDLRGGTFKGSNKDIFVPAGTDGGTTVGSMVKFVVI